MVRPLFYLALSCLLVTPAFAQLGGLKQRIGNNLGDAMQDHNDALNDAMNDKPKPPEPAPQVVAGQTLKTGWITKKSREGKPVRLYFAYPANLDKSKPAPALLVLQEWWGVNEDIQERTRDFAAKGFYAVAPDLFNGKTTDDPKVAAQLKQGLTDTDALASMKTGLDLLQEEVRNGLVDFKRVASIGWCMGGQQSLLLSLNDPRVKATVLFYGPLVTDPEQLRKLQGPVLAIFGNDDQAPSPDDVKKFKEAMQTAGKKDLTIYQFDHAGHAFASKSAEKVGLYKPEPAKEAWTKTWSWLEEKLHPGQ